MSIGWAKGVIQAAGSGGGGGVGTTATMYHSGGNWGGSSAHYFSPGTTIYLNAESNGGSGYFNTFFTVDRACLLYTSPSPRDVEESRMPSSA